MHTSFVVVQHHGVLADLGLTSIEKVWRFDGELVKRHRDRRVVVRIAPPAGGASRPVLYLKRILKPCRKDGLGSLLRRGKVWSAARQEWENSFALQRAGFRVPRMVAYGEECGPLWEKLSFIITQAADGDQTVQEFLRVCREKAPRRLVLDALACEIRRFHDAGFASPDVFSRHFFLDLRGGPRFCLIDMARLDQRRAIPGRLRARDLAALNVSVPLAYATSRERLRFLRIYADRERHALVSLIRRRMAQLLRRPQHREFFDPPG